jgi:hypothetical protein
VGITIATFFLSTLRRFKSSISRRAARPWNAFFDPSRSRMAEVQTECARLFVVHTESMAGNESDVFILECPSKKLVNIARSRPASAAMPIASNLAPNLPAPPVAVPANLS